MEKYPDTDALIVGSSNSLILGRYGYPVDKKIMSIIRKDARLKQAKIDVNAPLGRMYNKKIGKFVASSYPKAAIVELSKSDIDFLKDIVRTVKKKIKKSKESTQKLIGEGY